MASFHFSVKSGKKGTAVDHAAYIAREGSFNKLGKREDLIAQGHGNMLEWAKGNPKKFWGAADATERANGCAYREFVVALPTELTKEQILALVNDLIKQELVDKPFQFAIHAPHASLGSGLQPHLHLMFSDRRLDGIERGADQHFRRHRPANPTLGGAKKDSGGKDPVTLRESLIRQRGRWADLQNHHLEKNGHDARVDHRSHRDRGLETEPERHLGQGGVRQLTAVQKETFLTERKQGKSIE